MRKIILTDKRFKTPAEREAFSFMGVHTKNGDSIEIHFSLPRRAKGVLEFGYAGGFEHAVVKMDFARKRLSLATSEWQRRQPIARASFSLARKDTH
ncbi:MAG: hypothetical protein J7M14_03295, partial [Planctomycetes bacterium]|nr:hypothetical protein [Planctomycetota bacterium]